MQQEVLAILPARLSQPVPSPAALSTAQRKCPHSAISASCFVWGPPAPGPCTHSNFPLFPAVVASPLQMAFVWDPRGATVPGPSARVKSRLRFSKSYRYHSFLLVARKNLCPSTSVASGPLQIILCPFALIYATSIS